MWRVAISVAVGLLAGAAMAANETKPKPECRTAEINPVTGHVFCIDPLGAKVAPPPEDIAPACNEDDSRGQWTWSPNCHDAKGS